MRRFAAVRRRHRRHADDRDGAPAACARQAVRAALQRRAAAPPPASVDDLRRCAVARPRCSCTSRTKARAPTSRRWCRATRPGMHLYTCGAPRYMDGVFEAAAARGWPEEALHREYFSVPETDAWVNQPFRAAAGAQRHAASTVPADRSATDVLADGRRPRRHQMQRRPVRRLRDPLRRCRIRRDRAPRLRAQRRASASSA